MVGLSTIRGVYADGLPGPAWGFLGVVGGGIVAGVVQLVTSHRTERIEVRQASGSVETSDAALVFAQQQQVFAASEKLRHDMRDQIEHMQTEFAALKQENRDLEKKLHDQAEEHTATLAKWRDRVEVLEEELEDMSTRLAAEEKRNGRSGNTG
jgi:chromosome segregation ATPase